MAKRTRTLIVGNWKMNPQSADEAKTIFLGIRKASEKVKRVDTVVCPPFVLIPALEKLVAGRFATYLGAQDCFYEASGSFTGNISPALLKRSGVSYAIIGHSERRALGESDEVVNRKTIAALTAQLKPIICVGERERDADGKFYAEVEGQVATALKGVRKADLKNVIIAYEPVWAIGKKESEAMTPAQLQEMAIFIKKTLVELYDASAATLPVLYGGSVTSANTQGLLEVREVEGLLVGRASLDVKDFGLIIGLADKRA